jgi:hypothetical protein
MNGWTGPGFVTRVTKTQIMADFMRKNTRASCPHAKRSPKRCHPPRSRSRENPQGNQIRPIPVTQLGHDRIVHQEAQLVANRATVMMPNRLPHVHQSGTGG